jgi:hypothetical protein
VLRFALVSLSALAALVGAMMLSNAHGEPNKSAITGEWRGSYICAQGETALKLTVTPAKTDAIEARFDFGPLPRNPDVPKGAYAMQGTFDPASRRMVLNGVKWIDAPLMYVMVDLDGRMDAAGNLITGKVPGPGCTVFELRRDAQLIG